MSEKHPNPFTCTENVKRGNTKPKLTFEGKRQLLMAFV